MMPLAEAAPPHPGSPKSAPLISFGIPAYNRPHLLAETLASIAAQTAALDYEVVVCDDGQTDDNRRVVEQFPASPRLGRWLARFFTYRNALSYARRFAERPAQASRYQNS